METRVTYCYWCGHDFKAKAMGPLPRWCSYRCKSRYFYHKSRRRKKRCPDCGSRQVLPNHMLCRFCGYIRRAQNGNPVVPLGPSSAGCENCGGELVGQRSTKMFCSKKCLWTAKARRRGIEPRQEHTLKCRMCGISFESTNSQERFCCLEHQKRHAGLSKLEAHRLTVAKVHDARKGEYAQCICGDPFKVTHALQKYCSRDCYLFVKNGFPVPMEQRECLECGVTFEGYPHYRFCSLSCTKRAGKRRRRHRMRANVSERYEARYIYERDKWMCQLCGEKIDSSLDAPDPGAPSLDHIVPVSLGGSDIATNVQAAHFGCNARKGNRAVGSQLRLVG